MSSIPNNKRRSRAASAAALGLVLFAISFNVASAEDKKAEDGALSETLGRLEKRIAAVEERLGRSTQPVSFANTFERRIEELERSIVSMERAMRSIEERVRRLRELEKRLQELERQLQRSSHSKE
jgi:predicted  nucleic acid-binding Zn-ribbon protein